LGRAYAKLLRWSAKVENVVLACKLSEKVNLKHVHAALKNSTLNDNSRFPGVTYRMKDPRATVMVFRGQNVVCTGAASEALAWEAVEKLFKELRGRGVVPPSCTCNCSVQNVVVCVHVEDADFNLEGIIEAGMAAMDKKRFPAATLKLRDPKATLLLFPKGKIICHAQSLDIIRQAVETLLSTLREKNLIETF
jgi:transcription initiation factor TFIID TATA-box-binding protein